MTDERNVLNREWFARWRTPSVRLVDEPEGAVYELCANGMDLSIENGDTVTIHAAEKFLGAALLVGIVEE